MLTRPARRALVLGAVSALLVALDIARMRGHPLHR